MYNNDIPVIILAGGLGSRLSPLTNNKPKILCDFVNQPFIYYIYNYIKTYLPHSPIFISSGYMSHTIKPIAEQLNIQCIEETTSLGTGGAILNVMKEMTDYKSSVILNGDLITNVDLSKLIHHHKAYERWMTITSVSQFNTSRYGNISTSKACHLEEFLEKPSESPAFGLISAGIYVADIEHFIHKAPANIFSIERDILSLDKDITVYHQDNGFIKDIGTLKSYLYAQVEMNNGHSVVSPKSLIGEGTILDRSVILSDTMIGKKCRIENCIIGNNCKILDNTFLKNTCLADGSTIMGKNFD